MDGTYTVEIPLNDGKSMVIGPYPTEESAKESLDLIKEYRRAVFENKSV